MPSGWFIRNVSTDRATGQIWLETSSVTSPELPVTFPKSSVTMPKPPVTLLRNTHAGTRGGQGAVDGGGTDLHEPGADIRVKLQMTVPLHGNDEDRDERLQALAADAVACLPQHDQRLPYRFVVHAVPRRSRRLR